MQHSILVASRRSGLSQHVIRAWEKRYQVLSPCRCEKNQRLYSDQDIERLMILRDLTQQGHRISRIATSCTDTLRDLLSRSSQPRTSIGSLETPMDFIKACREAAQGYEADKLRCLLDHARFYLGHRQALRQVVAPVIAGLSDVWREGKTGEAHEHLQAAVVHEFLAMPPPGAMIPATAPELVVTTPCGTRHELGALLVTATARGLGWRATYLGSCLGAAEIAKVVVARRARAVALSIVHPSGCPNILAELQELRRLLPSTVDILIGGVAAPAYRDAVEDEDAYFWLLDLDDVEERLMQLL